MFMIEGNAQPEEIDNTLLPDLGIREMQRDSHQNAVAKGFWNKVGDTTLAYLGKLMLITCEIAEVAEELRRVPERPAVYYVDGKPEGEGIELADILLRIGDYADKRKIDLATCVRIKREYNAKRPYMHGRAA